MNWRNVLIACGCRPSTADLWADPFERLATPEFFSKGLAEIDDFLAQVLHESGMLEHTVENLNYSSPDRLMAVWPRRFPTERSAVQFVRNPQGLANLVYGQRMGNTQPNDGWMYRGRGLIMVTGKDNYRTVGKAIGIDLVAEPDKLATPYVALRASIAWWEGRIPDAALGDVVRVTKLVNGGTVGLEHRRKLAALAANAIKAEAA